MTHTAAARLVVSETEAAALAAAIAADPVLGEEAIDASEVAPGRWEVVVYLAGEPDARQRAALERHGTFAIARLPEIDWVAKSLEGLRPVRAGRFVVHGRHDRDRLRSNDIGIEIEAGQAFGTGHHGTTAGCLVAIDGLARRRAIRRALDIGTGTGVLAVALARAAKARVVASDVDPVAAAIAHDNARANGVARLVRTVRADGLSVRAIAASAPFDLIVANILAGPLVALAPSIRRALAPGGTTILSGLLPEQRARIVAAYRGQGLRLAGWRVVDGWLTVTFARPMQPAARGARRPSVR